MPDWINYLLVFFLGTGVGAVLAPRLSGLGGSPASREKKKSLSRLYKELPAFFDALRADLDTPEGRQFSEFAILESSRTTFVSEVLRLVYFEEDMPGLKSVAGKLDDAGLVDNVTSGETPIYRMRDSFISALKTLK
jgi:hypothetical protein